MNVKMKIKKKVRVQIINKVVSSNAVILIITKFSQTRTYLFIILE